MSHKSSFRGLKGPVIISACLLGITCRYDGRSKLHEGLITHPGIIPIPVCPEQLGGLATPRPKACFVGGDGICVLNGGAILINDAGVDVTRNFIEGARHVIRIARLVNARFAILKEKSPSCGSHKVWVGEDLTEGAGVCAAMLAGIGVSIMNEDGVE